MTSSAASFHDLPLPERLSIAHRGTSYFAQHVAALTDADLDGASRLPGWTRKHVVAHVGYNALALCRLMDWAATGVANPMYPSSEHRAQEIEDGATQGATAIRNLFTHSAAQLDEQWRSLDSARWDHPVRTRQGKKIPAAETAWMRTREVWIHAVDLGSGARFDDFPEVVLGSLLTDIVSSWDAAGADLALDVDGQAPRSAGTSRVVRGSLAAVVQWAAGRGGDGLTSAAPEPPRWL